MVPLRSVRKGNYVIFRNIMGKACLLMVAVVFCSVIPDQAEARKKSKSRNADHLCHKIADVAIAEINQGYHTDQGRIFKTDPERGFSQTPYTQSIPCSTKGLYDLKGHRFIISNTFSTSFIGRNAGRPVHTMYEVTITGDACADIPQLNFFTKRVRSDHQAGVEHPVLKNYFTYESNYWGRFDDRLYGIRKLQCPSLGVDKYSPDTMRVHIYDDGRNTGQPQTQFQQYDKKKIGPFKLLFSGTFVTDYREPKRWYDDDPTDRYEYRRREAEYQARLAEIGRLRRAQEDAFWSSVAALSFGYIQGISLEMADEGLCAFLASNEAMEIDKITYIRCHNYLYEAYEQLQKNSPDAYLVGKLLSLTNTSFDAFLEESTTREGEAMRLGTAKCMDFMVSEYFSKQIGDRPTDEELQVACKNGALVGGLMGGISGPAKNGETK